jgi:hypothetical protein
VTILLFSFFFRNRNVVLVARSQLEFSATSRKITLLALLVEVLGTIGMQTLFDCKPNSVFQIFKSAWRVYKPTLRVFIILGSGRHLGTLLLAVNSSYFALFSLIVCFLDVFLDANCSTCSILAFCHYAPILGRFISAAQ